MIKAKSPQNLDDTIRAQLLFEERWKEESIQRTCGINLDEHLEQISEHMVFIQHNYCAAVLCALLELWEQTNEKN